jgi:hypothetical protein
MNARRDDLIRLAAETLGCVDQTAHGHWIYREAQTGLWVVTDDSMETLGRLTTEHDEVLGHHIWCERTTATEIDVDTYVRDYDVDSSTDLDALMSECAGEIRSTWKDFGGPKPALVFYLVLKFYRQDVVDTIRINDEIDRDNEDGEVES